MLLVEGLDDENVVRHLCRRAGLEDKFHIKNKDGKDALLKGISIEAKVSDREALGILVDADSDVQCRWNEVTEKLLQADVATPDEPDPSGTVIDNKPRVGIWLMPDNVSKGELEDFFVGMIPRDDPVWPRSKAYICGIPILEREFASGKTLRAKVHSWLATRPKPGLMGAAIRDGYLNPDTSGAVRFVDWLRRLFT